jgi:starch synthase
MTFVQCAHGRNESNRAFCPELLQSWLNRPAIVKNLQLGKGKVPQESDFQGLEGAYIRFFCYNFVAAFYKRMEKKKKILFVSSEMAPFIEDSPVGAIARFLPQAIQEKNHEIRILVPRFGVINERRNRLHEVVRLSGINITIDDNDNPLIIKVASIPQTKMQVYFLDNEDYFHRKAIYNDDDGSFFEDNDERTIFFCKGVLETVKKLGWAPDIIHCQGWMTSLIPIYLKTLYKDEPVFRHSKVVYSVFDKEFDHCLGKDFARKASLNSLLDEQLSCFEDGDCVSLQIGGVKHADAIVQVASNVDPNIAKHISDKPCIRHSDDACADCYSDLYDQLLNTAV